MMLQNSRLLELDRNEKSPTQVPVADALQTRSSSLVPKKREPPREVLSDLEESPLKITGRSRSGNVNITMNFTNVTGAISLFNNAREAANTPKRDNVIVESLQNIPGLETPFEFPFSAQVDQLSTPEEAKAFSQLEEAHRERQNLENDDDQTVDTNLVLSMNSVDWKMVTWSQPSQL
jgi:hypothetical protein